VIDDAIKLTRLANSTHCRYFTVSPPAQAVELELWAEARVKFSRASGIDIGPTLKIATRFGLATFIPLSLGHSATVTPLSCWNKSPVAAPTDFLGFYQYFLQILSD
jgi:hypothetical protein